jgi:protein-L-isoaspartate(D-aspartate) O-methyltransferase
MKAAWHSFTIAYSGALSYLTVRNLPDGRSVEFDAMAYGYHAAQAAASLVSHLRTWDDRGGDPPQDAFTYWPGGTPHPIPVSLLSVFPKRHGTATIAWPPKQTGAEKLIPCESFRDGWQVSRDLASDSPACRVCL